MSKTLEIKTKAPKAGNKEAVVSFETGATLEESAELFGEATVLSMFERQLMVAIQAGVRKCLENGQDPQKWVNTFKPGVKAPSIAKDPVAAARSAISQMTEEEKAALIAQLQEG